VYERVHGSRQWERLVANVEALLAANAAQPRDLPIIGLQMIETPEARDEIAAFRALWEPRIAGMTNVVLNVKPYTTWAGQIGTSPAAGAAGQWFVHKACTYPFEMLVVCSDGSVAPCCYDMDCTMRLGDVREQSLAEVWRAAPLRDLRADMRRGALGRRPLCRKS